MEVIEFLGSLKQERTQLLTKEKCVPLETINILGKPNCIQEKCVPLETHFLQLGYQDSNLEMLESESSALPFGDSPIYNK